jgi:transcriptional regulator GlxA family with amidase domain
VNRRRFLGAAAASAAVAAGPVAAWTLAGKGSGEEALPARPIKPPADGVVRTAFAIGPGVNLIDTAGPWETFCDTAIYGGGRARFELFTVAGSTDPVETNGGLTITPRYTYKDAPQPQLVVVPAHTETDETLAWLRHVAERADLVMSVCTGAFVLARTGLLDGKTATTHHNSYAAFAAAFPKVDLVRGRRFVEHEHFATAGGLTSGIDLALRVVDRYLGKAGAGATANYLEYASRAATAT